MPPRFFLAIAAPFYCVRFFLGINGIRLGFATVETLRRFLSDRNREVSGAAKTAQPSPAAPQREPSGAGAALSAAGMEGPHMPSVKSALNLRVVGKISVGGDQPPAGASYAPLLNAFLSQRFIKHVALRKFRVMAAFVPQNSYFHLSRSAALHKQGGTAVCRPSKCF